MWKRLDDMVSVVPSWLLRQCDAALSVQAGLVVLIWGIPRPHVNQASRLDVLSGARGRLRIALSFVSTPRIRPVSAQA